MSDDDEKKGRTPDVDGEGKEQGDTALATAIAQGLEPFTDSVKGIDTRVGELEKLLQARKMYLPGLEEEAKRGKFQLRKVLWALKSQASEAVKAAGYELDVCKEFWKKHGDLWVGIHGKDLSTDVDTAGGYLVPAQVMPDFIELLRAMTVVRELGATSVTGLESSPILFPKQTGAGTAYWVDENADITESQQTFGQVKGQTRQLAALTVVSNLLLQQSDPSVNAIIQRDLARILALALDNAAIQGTGVDGQPLGILTDSDVDDESLATVDFDKLMDFQNTVAAADAEEGNLGWAMSPNGWNIIRQLKDDDGRYFLNPNLGEKESKQLLGAQVRTTTQLATTDVVYGNWADQLLLEWGAIEFRASAETSDAFKKNQTWIRAIMLVDAIRRRNASFVKADDLAA